MRNIVPITTIRVFSAAAIARNGNVISQAINLTNATQIRRFGIQYAIAGTGTVKFRFLYAPTLNDFFTDQPLSQFPGSASGAGNFITSASPFVSPFIKIAAYEQNVGDISSLDLWFNVQ